MDVEKSGIGVHDVKESIKVIQRKKKEECLLLFLRLEFSS